MKKNTTTQYIGRPMGLIPAELEDAAWRVLTKHMHQASPAREQLIQARLAQYKKQHMSAGAPSQQRIWKISFQTLHEFLALDDIPVTELFAAIHVTAVWPSEEARIFAEIFSSLPEEYKQTVLLVIKRLAPAFFTAPDPDKDTWLKAPTKRVQYLLRHMPNVGDRAVVRLAQSCNSERLRAALVDRHEGTTSDVAGIFEAAEFLNVSPAWLFGFCDGTADMPILANEAIDERATAGYLLLSPRQKNVIRELLSMLGRDME